MTKIKKKIFSYIFYLLKTDKFQFSKLCNKILIELKKLFYLI